jgi:hypothetical protein
MSDLGKLLIAFGIVLVVAGVVLSCVVVIAVFVWKVEAVTDGLSCRLQPFNWEKSAERKHPNHRGARKFAEECRSRRLHW